MADTFRLVQAFGYGHGSQFNVLGVAPAAGANFTLSLDANYTWRLAAACFVFTADGNAANRALTIERQDSGGNTLEAVGLPAVVTANGSVTVRASLAYTTMLAVTSGAVFVPVPRSFMFGGDKLALVASNIQATDAFTAIRLTFDRFQTNAEPIAGETE